MSIVLTWMPLFGKLTIGRLDFEWTKCQERKSRSSDAKRFVSVWWLAQLMAIDAWREVKTHLIFSK
jgi:hypothetical protein